MKAVSIEFRLDGEHGEYDVTWNSDTGRLTISDTFLTCQYLQIDLYDPEGIRLDVYNGAETDSAYADIQDGEIRKA
jgi:hypothetical protein